MARKSYCDKLSTDGQFDGLVVIGRNRKTYKRIGGSVVKCSPATRAARVRFPADALFCSVLI